MLVIWPVYQFHIWNYPAEQQLRDTIADISNHPVPTAKNITIWMTKQEALRAPAQFLRGLLMASQRTFWGNTAYFLGEISTKSWWYYFPLIYFLKEHLAIHVFSIFAICFFLIWLKKNSRRLILDSARRNFWVIAFFLWLVVYWTAAIAGNLNIGVRHLLPVFPFMYILATFGLYQAITIIKAKRVAIIFCAFLFGWYLFSSLSTFPYYLSYYNELAGGTAKGYKIAVDSNYDWGQDFYHLLAFVEKEKIEKIYLACGQSRLLYCHLSD